MPGQTDQVYRQQTVVKKETSLSPVTSPTLRKDSLPSQKTKTKSRFSKLISSNKVPEPTISMTIEKEVDLKSATPNVEENSKQPENFETKDFPTIEAS